MIDRKGGKVAVWTREGTHSEVSNYAARVFTKETRGVVAVTADNGEVFYQDLDNPFVITVSATRTEERKAPWATYGPATDLSALGQFIIAPLTGGGYAWAMGTSYSVPIVARVAALVLSTNPNLTAEQLERIFLGLLMILVHRIGILSMVMVCLMQ
jgi:serine protease